MTSRRAVGLLLLEAGLASASAAASTPVVVLHASLWHEAGQITLVDRDSFAILGTAAIDRSPWALRFDAAGTSLFAVGSVRPGVPASSVKKPATLWSIDTGSGDGVSLGTLGRALTYFTDPHGERLYVVEGSRKAKSKAISVFDLSGRKPLGRLSSVERLVSLRLSPDGTLLYAFCEGRPHQHPKGPPGNLHLIDSRSGAELARLEVGKGASDVAFDRTRGLAYVLGASDDEGAGRVTVLRGFAIEGRVALPGAALDRRDGPDGTPYLLTRGAIVALDDRGLAVTHTWPLNFDPSDLVFDPPYGVMFASAGFGSRIAAMSMSGGEVIAEHPTGSGGRKFGKGVGEAIVFIFAVAAAAGGAPVASPLLPGHTGTTMALGPDGAMLYVLNPYTNDVSLFDVAKRDVVGILHTGGSSRLLRVPGEPGLWVRTHAELLRIDTSTHRIDCAIDLSPHSADPAVAVDPERGLAWVLVRSRILIVDLHAGAIVHAIDLPAPAFDIWMEGPAGGGPSAPPP